MFDAKSLLEALMKGSAPAQQPQAGGMGGLGDLLGQMMGGGKPGAGAAQNAGPGGMGGLGDLLGKLGGGSQGGAPAGGQAGGMGGLEDMLRKMMPGGAQGGQPAQGGGGLGDLLGKLGGGSGQHGAAPGAQQGGGGLADILGQILGQATSGVKEVGQKVEQHTGVGGRAREAVTQTTGQSPDEMMAKLKELIAQHQMGAAATAGGLGAVVLGTKTGRSAAMGAAKLGALALIGGLAYKAYQNYSQGKPLVSGASGFAAEQAPSGSGFEPQAVTNDTAILYIRAMIAAAAADGRIDQGEQQKIMGALKQAGGVDEAAREFLMREINNPATADELAAACQSGEQAVQVFTAARIAVDLDTNEENDFLVDLATKLGIEPKLAQHIDAAATAQAA
jgi:uncharacterized membrane protein YebE (DUF533 family)